MGVKELDGRVAIVTGASRGIGKAIALALADLGAAVVVAARTMEENDQVKGSLVRTSEEIKNRGSKAIPIQTNVADDGSVENMVKTTLKEMGQIDILVNNAGTSIRRLFREMPLKQWDLVMKVTLRSVISCTKAVLPAMMEKKRGHIINISSVAAVTINDPFTGLAYDCSKAAINRFTWGLAEEMREYNILVNALMPENTRSDGWIMVNPDADKSGWQAPELWGKITAFLATRESKEFTGRILTAEEVEREIAARGWNM
jgi:citronellol/citronellal dehydrogenase